MSKYPIFDQEKHILLHDQAHRRRIPPDSEEFKEYADQVAEELTVFNVEIPDWPPVPRTPLAMIFTIGGGSGDGGPFGDQPWTGVQPAVERSFHNNNLTYRLARDMAPDTFTQERQSYEWQIPVFDPAKHVVIRSWLDNAGVDIVYFWTTFRKEHQSLEIVKTTNQLIKKEAATGSWAPSRRCFLVEQEHIMEKSKAAPKQKPAPVVPSPEADLPSLTPAPEEHDTEDERYRIGVAIGFSKRRSGPFWHPVKPHTLPRMFHRPHGDALVVRRTDSGCEVRAWGTPEIMEPFDLNGVSIRMVRWQNKDLAYRCCSLDHAAFRKITGLSEGEDATEKPEPKPEPKPKPILSIPKPIPAPDEPEAEEIDTSVPIDEGSVAYTPTEVATALRHKLGREFGLFGGQTSDSMVVGMTIEAVKLFLASDPTDRLRYVNDVGGRNYDCDNFADSLRNALQVQHGMNGVGVIWGDAHAWNFFVVVERYGPGIVFVEPQEDNIIGELSGQYSVRRRCEIYL